MSKQNRLLAEQVGCCSPLVREPLSVEQAAELSRLFKAMGDPVRLRLLSLIASHEDGEACVCDLTDVFNLTGPTISHHLKVLREAGLIAGERRGTWIYYRVQPHALQRLSDVLVSGSSAAGLPVVGARGPRPTPGPTRRRPASSSSFPPELGPCQPGSPAPWQ